MFNHRTSENLCFKYDSLKKHTPTKITLPPGRPVVFVALSARSHFITFLFCPFITCIIFIPVKLKCWTLIFRTVDFSFVIRLYKLNVHLVFCTFHLFLVRFLLSFEDLTLRQCLLHSLISFLSLFITLLALHVVTWEIILKSFFPLDKRTSIVMSSKVSKISYHELKTELVHNRSPRWNIEFFFTVISLQELCLCTFPFS